MSFEIVFWEELLFIIFLFCCNPFRRANFRASRALLKDTNFDGKTKGVKIRKRRGLGGLAPWKHTVNCRKLLTWVMAPLFLLAFETYVKFPIISEIFAGLCKRNGFFCPPPHFLLAPCQKFAAVNCIFVIWNGIAGKNWKFSVLL